MDYSKLSKKDLIEKIIQIEKASNRALTKYDGNNLNETWMDQLGSMLGTVKYIYFDILEKED